MTDLSHETAVVTGASGGLERRFARTLARLGAHVIAGARRPEALEALADELAAEGLKGTPAPLDVADLGSPPLLASPASASMTGSALVVDGGYAVASL